MEEIQSFASVLKPAYAGDKFEEIEDKERQIIQEWESLLARVRERGSKLGDSDEFQRFFLRIQDLLIWIKDMRQEIASDKKPRYVGRGFECWFQLKSLYSLFSNYEYNWCLGVDIQY